MMPPEDTQDTALLDRGLRAAWQIVRDPKLREQLLQDDDNQFAKFLTDNELPESAEAPLFQIIERVEHIRDPLTQPATAPKANANESPKSPDEDNVGKILLETFTHIRWSFWISMAMSIVMFVVGIILLIISVNRALSETNVSTATLTIAGLSIADFALLFYSRPWKDIATNLSNTQQVKIIATSYLSSLDLLRKGRLEELKALDKITKNAVGLLEEYTEEKGRMKIEDNNEA